MKKAANALRIALVTLTGSLAASQVVAAEDEGWNFAVAPLYLWGKSIEGAATAGPRELPLDLDFQDDILENLDTAFAIHFEANKGDWTFFLEYNFARLDPGTEQNIGPIQIKADVEFEDTMWEGGAAWAFADSGSTRWELLGGLRYLEHDLEIDVESSLPVDLPFPNNITGGDDWVHPFLGVRVITKLSDRWTFRARGDYGYEDSDNNALQGILTFDYRFRDWGSAFLGYRYLDIDYLNNARNFQRYGFDGDEQGPLIGLNFYF